MQKNHTEIKAGEMVTTVCNFGGIGIGYLIDGTVWQTTGSYWGIRAKTV